MEEKKEKKAAVISRVRPTCLPRTLERESLFSPWTMIITSSLWDNLERWCIDYRQSHTSEYEMIWTDVMNSESWIQSSDYLVDRSNDILLNRLCSSMRKNMQEKKEKKAAVISRVRPTCLPRTLERESLFSPWTMIITSSLWDNLERWCIDYRQSHTSEYEMIWTDVMNSESWIQSSDYLVDRSNDILLNRLCSSMRKNMQEKKEKKAAVNNRVRSTCLSRTLERESLSSPWTMINTSSLWDNLERWCIDYRQSHTLECEMIWTDGRNSESWIQSNDYHVDRSNDIL